MACLQLHLPLYSIDNYSEIPLPHMDRRQYHDARPRPTSLPPQTSPTPKLYPVAVVPNTLAQNLYSLWIHLHPTSHRLHHPRPHHIRLPSLVNHPRHHRSPFLHMSLWPMHLISVIPLMRHDCRCGPLSHPRREMMRYAKCRSIKRGV